MDGGQDVQEIARGRVARLVENWDWPEPQILEDIVALGEAAIPAIEAVLTPELVVDAEIDDQASTTVYYLSEALGAIGSPRAIPILIDLYRRVDDDMIESLPDTLLPLGPEAIDPLLGLVAEGSLTWFQRARAAETASALAGEDAGLKAHVAAGLRGVLADFVARAESLSDDDLDTVASVVADLANLADPEARPLINAAFAAGIVGQRPDEDASPLSSIPLIDQSGVEEAYREGGRTHFWKPRPFLERYPDDRRKHFEEEEKRRKNKSLLRILEGEETETVIRGPRIGRNDPCWCGSGKKYKKCHLAEDEKLGR